MVTTFKGLANKWVFLALLLASLGAVLAITLLPAGAQDPPITFAEIPDGTDDPDLTVADFTVVDPEGRQVEWRALAGTDADLFIFEDGILSFDPADFPDGPNFEAPRDGNTDNTYQLTLQASDQIGGGGSPNGTKDITVQVTNVDEEATTKIDLSLLQPREGDKIKVLYVDDFGNPFVGTDGNPNNGIVDPDGDKDATNNTLSGTDFNIPADDVKWQWSRGASRTGIFTDIKGATGDAYSTVDADNNRYLRVTASYLDGKDDGARKTLTATSRYTQRPLRTDGTPPEFPDFDPGDANLRTPPEGEIKDGSTERTTVGEPVTAKASSIESNYGEILTYSLEGTGDNPEHADHFMIDRQSGQVMVGLGKTINPNNDNITPAPEGFVRALTGNEFTVSIKVVDGYVNKVPDPVVPNEDDIDMTISVTSIDEAPVFTEGDTSIPHEENDTNLVLDTFAAYDAEGGTVTYVLTGDDESQFNTGDFASDGILRFASVRDFEIPGDDNDDNVYEVTVQATATSDAIAGAEAKTTEINVKVTVSNEQDPGKIELSARQPRIGVQISATEPEDDDGDVMGKVDWQWETTTTSDCTASNLSWAYAMGDGATTDTYEPEPDDEGKCLRVVATYKDPQGDGSAIKVSDQTVQKARNLAPRFSDDVGDRYVAENAVAGAVVKATTGDANATIDPVRATDTLDDETGDDDKIKYTLTGADANYFSIQSDDADNNIVGGQISVSAAGQKLPLDRETRRTYMVTVTATDLEGLKSSVDVTIKVTNVNEPPEIMQGRLAVSGIPLRDNYPSLDTGDVATYTAVGTASSGATWTVTGDDAADFNISTDGVLTFKTPPNKNSPADANKDNVYKVTVVATSGSLTAVKPVTVTVGEAKIIVPPPASEFDQLDLDNSGFIEADELQKAIAFWIQGGSKPGN